MALLTNHITATEKRLKLTHY